MHGGPLKYSEGSAKFAHRSLTNHKMERISAITATISCFCLPNWHATDTSVAVGSSGKWIGYVITPCNNVQLCKKCRYMYTHAYVHEVGRGTNSVSILTFIVFQGQAEYMSLMGSFGKGMNLANILKLNKSTSANQR